MTTYKEVELKNIIEECGGITITIVTNGEGVDETFTDFDEAKSAILFHEIGSEVYF